MFIPEKVSERGITYSSILSGMVEGGYGTNQITRYFRKEGIGYDQNKMVSDIRQFRIAKEGFQAVKRLPGFLIPPTDYIKTPNYTTVQERYAAVITGKFWDEDLEEEVELTRTIAFDSQMSKSAMVKDFDEMMKRGASEVPYKFIDAEVDYIFKGLRQ